MTKPGFEGLQSAIIDKGARAIAKRMSVHEFANEAVMYLTSVAFPALPEPVPETDSRFDAELYASLRPNLKRVLIVPAFPVSGSGLDSLGPKLKAFLEKGI
ncbi:hypothetical protein H9P43_008731 [Blastocladiella emersonii ATCC 22665]|nr:hypothetical protein H9P43_008731 [Blastocladiella emersonii ATCC 22665]